MDCMRAWDYVYYAHFCANWRGATQPLGFSSTTWLLNQWSCVYEKPRKRWKMATALGCSVPKFSVLLREWGFSKTFWSYLFGALHLWAIMSGQSEGQWKPGKLCDLKVYFEICIFKFTSSKQKIFLFYCFPICVRSSFSICYYYRKLLGLK